MAIFNKQPKPSEVSLTISIETYVRVVLLIVGTIIIVGALHKAAHALILIFAAFFLTLSLNAPVQWIANKLPGKEKDSRSLATTLSFLIVIIILGSFFSVVVPPLVKQTQSFMHAAPLLIKDFNIQNGPLGNLIKTYHLQNQVQRFSSQLTSHLNNAGGAAFSTLQSIGTSIFTIVTVIVLTFMMLVEGPHWVNVAKEMIPDKQSKLIDRLARDMYSVIKGFVNGQVMLAAIAAVLISPALFLLHISYPVALILVIFICGLIPMVGHTIGALIITTVALFHSTSSAVIILAYYLLYQQFENYIIQPRIQANTTNMSPLLVFVAVVIGVSFGGLFGGLVSIPVAGCIRIALIEYLQHINVIEPNTNL